jgi:hypothetical protein
MTMRGMVKLAFAIPFRPFRILMDDGATWHIHHPDMIAVGKTKVFLDTRMSELNCLRKSLPIIESPQV